MKKRTLLWLVLALVIFGGGAWMAQETNLFGGITLSPRAKQLAYLKEHEEEIVKWIKSRHPKITTVNFDWNTYRVGAVSNGVQIVGYNLSVKGTFNDNPDTVLVIDFSLNNEDSIPNMKDIGMINPPSIKKGKGLYIFE